MSTLDELLERVRTWPAERQAEVELMLRAIEDRDDLAMLKQAYDEGMASGPGREISLEELLAQFRERANPRG